jgi:hypothetical protein
MGKQFAKLALSAVLAMGLWVDVQACECLRLDTAATYKESTHVFLGEVVRVEALPKSGGDKSETAEYVAVLKAVETYKGKPGREVRVRFSVSLTSRSSCGASMRVGERYVILEREPTPLIYESYCSSRIRPATKYMMDYLKNLP